jgi:hypothetical protein
VVEPDDAEHVGSRSWIIYVLGGSYPENHPLLNTPSLFTDTPTYEDMLLLSSLLGPAKPPVASESDLASAPGLFRIAIGETPGTLVAIAVDSEERVLITAEQRCLVCLCDFEETEEARRLVQCGHLFHKDCIDQVSSTSDVTLAKDMLTLLPVAHNWSELLPTVPARRSAEIVRDGKRIGRAVGHSSASLNPAVYV